MTIFKLWQQETPSPRASTPPPDRAIDALDTRDVGRLGMMAENLRSDPLLNAILDSIERHHRDTWENSAPDNAELRHQSYLALRAVKDIRINIRCHLARAEEVAKRNEAMERAGMKPRTGLQ